MATEKNITMKQFNGTDYDTLYPKTIAEQVDGVYSAEETLTNSTKTSFGLPNTAVPDDVFKQIASKDAAGLSKIGDVLLTARRDLGEKWLLCNGENVDPDEYPTLASLIKHISGQQLDTNQGTLFDVAGYNNMWVAIGNTSDNYPCAYVTNDLDGKWTRVMLSSTRVAFMAAIAYYNGLWVAGGRTTSSLPIFYTATDPFGAWTEVYISTTTVIINDMACYNGVWVAVGSSNDTPYVLTATDPTGAWTISTLPVSQYGHANGVACYNGTWVISGDIGTTTKYPYIWTSTSPSGSWTGLQIESTLNGSLDKIACHDGVWVAYGTTGSNVTYVWSVNNNNVAGVWSRQVIDADVFNPRDIIYCNGEWIVFGFNASNIATMYTTSTPTSGWIKYMLSNTAKIYPIGAICVNDTWTVVGYDNQQSNYDYPYMFSNGFYALPVLSYDNIYGYIKALE